MKVRITLTLDIDPEVWGLEYGAAPEDMRDDVRSYVLDAIQQSAAGDSGAIREVALRA